MMKATSSTDVVMQYLLHMKFPLIHNLTSLVINKAHDQVITFVKIIHCTTNKVNSLYNYFSRIINSLMPEEVGHVLSAFS